MSECYDVCNKKYGVLDSKRTYCKKGCDSEEDLEKCKSDDCASKCIKTTLGDEESGGLGNWSKWLSRAPKDSTDCLTACYFGCNNRPEEADGKDDD